jgi:5-methyltetrahydrofolate--homocysteine methyltransferase
MLSRGVGVASNLLSGDLREDFVKSVREEYGEVRERHKGREAKTKQHSLEEARRNKFNWGNYQPAKPSFIGNKVIERFPLDTLVWYIDWSPFFQTWEMAGSYPKILDDKVVGVEARKLFDDAQVMLKKIISEEWLSARAVVGFFPANSDGDDVIVYTDDNRNKRLETLHHLRQQNVKAPGRPNYCLSDFIAPIDSGIADYIGAFAVTTGIGIEAKLQQFEQDHDDYCSIMLKALADRLAVAFAYLHQWSEKTIGAIRR